MDKEVAVALEKQMSSKGIAVCCNSTVEEIVKEDGLSCIIRNHVDVYKRQQCVPGTGSDA